MNSPVWQLLQSWKCHQVESNSDKCSIVYVCIICFILGKGYISRQMIVILGDFSNQTSQRSLHKTMAHQPEGNAKWFSIPPVKYNKKGNEFESKRWTDPTPWSTLNFLMKETAPAELLIQKPSKVFIEMNSNRKKKQV